MALFFKHTQFGTLTVASLVIPILLIIIASYFVGWHPISIAVLLILSISLFLFHSLTVEIGSKSLEVYFGCGIIRKGWDIKEIIDVEMVKNPWYYGWGIRLTPRGWLYNVSGSDAVEITMKSGKRYRIGTDRPQELKRMIESAVTGARGYPEETK